MRDALLVGGAVVISLSLYRILMSTIQKEKAAPSGPAPPTVYSLDAIKRGLPSNADLLEQLATSFADLAAGRVKLGTVGDLLLPERNGEVHIKSAYCVGGSTWVAKVAGGWYDNPKNFGLGSGLGMMLVFSQTQGFPQAVLLDGGFLTDLRTALSACITAKALAPARPRAIGIVGAGAIPRLLLETLASAIPPETCREIRIWARREEAARALADAANAANASGGGVKWHASVARTVQDVANECDVIFTCTPSKEALLTDEHIAARQRALAAGGGGAKRGLHIHALGSDSPGKQELDPRLLARADLVVPDAVHQTFAYGECCHAKAAGLLREEDAKVVELGKLLSPTHQHLQRDEEDEDDVRLTIADSTGVGASDLCIAEAAYRALAPRGTAPPAAAPTHVWRGSQRRSRL